MPLNTGFHPNSPGSAHKGGGHCVVTWKILNGNQEMEKLHLIVSHQETGLGSSCKLDILYCSVTTTFRVSQMTVEPLSQLNCALIHCENRAPSCALSTDTEGRTSLFWPEKFGGGLFSGGVRLFFSWLQDNKNTLQNIRLLLLHWSREKGVVADV